MAGVIRMKTMLVTVLDVGPSMSTATSECTSVGTGPSKMMIAKSFFGSYLIERMMASKTTEFCLFANGDDTTSNYINGTQGGYDRINEIFPLKRANLEMIEATYSLSCGSAPGDMIDGIVVGFDTLNRTNVGKAFNKILLLITDGETDIQGVEDLNTVVENMKKDFCAVYVLFLGKVSNTSSAFKIQSASILKTIANLTQGKYCEANDLSECMALLTSAPGLSSKPRHNHYVFEIAPYMRVPCVTWNKTKPIAFPSLKKAPIPTCAYSATGGDNNDFNELSSVKTDITWRNPADEDEEVSLNDRIKGYKYGSQYVPIQGDEEKEFHIPGKPIIQLIGFVKSTAVPRHHYLSKSVAFEGNPGIPSAVNTVRALHNGMVSTDTVALVRFVSKLDSDPCLCVLIPNINEKDKNTSLILHRLPVRDDIREYAYPSFNLDILKNDQKESIKQFVSTMLINPTPLQLNPFNPTKLDIILEIQKKILHHPSYFEKKIIKDEDEVEKEISIFKEPLESVMTDSVISALQKLRSTFPLKVSVEKINKKRIYWSDIQINSGEESTSSNNNNNNNNSNGSNKKQKKEYNEKDEIDTDEDKERARTNAVHAAASSAVQQFTGSSLNPTEEFRTVLSVISMMGPTGRSGDGDGVGVGRPMCDITPGALAMGYTSQILSGIENIDLSRNHDSSSSSSNKSSGNNNNDSNSNDNNSTSSCNSSSSSKKHITNIVDNKLQEARRELVSAAMDVMTGIIENLVTAGGSAAYHRKALSCLEVLRHAAVKESVYSIFNIFLKNIIKDVYSNMPRCQPFWTMVVGKGITLISQLEVHESDVTIDVASKFLCMDEIIIVKEIVKEEDIVEDDLFAEME